MGRTNKELSIGEVGVINGKTVLCAELPWQYDCTYACPCCAFDGCDYKDCPPCGLGYQHHEGKNVYYPEIKKGL